MSDSHVLAITKNLKYVNVVFHFPIPETITKAGISQQAALLKSQGGSEKIISVLPDILSEELTKIKAGGILEHVTRVKFSNSNLTDDQRIEEIKIAYKAKKITILKSKQTTLNLYGVSIDAA